MLAAVTEPGLINLILVIALVGWAATARLVRAQTLAVRSRKFVLRARALGAGRLRVLLTHVAPQVLPLVVANGVLVVSQSILAESTLSFLGLGDPDRTSWGQMLQMATARGAMSAGAWWALLGPGLGIVASVGGCALRRPVESERRLRGPRRHWLEEHRRGAADSRRSPSPVPGRAALLEVRDLTVEYAPATEPPVRAVDRVDFTVGRGESRRPGRRERLRQDDAAPRASPACCRRAHASRRATSGSPAATCSVCPRRRCGDCAAARSGSCRRAR